jgi:hypothetical protein
MRRLALNILRISAVALLGLHPLAASAHDPTSEMAGAANTWLASLNDAQRQTATFEFTDAERVNWHFIPRDRKGLAWKDMAPAQRHLATGLLASGLSQRGFVKATTIMSLEQVLLELEQGKGPKRDPENYYWSIFGKPAASGAWGWRVEGHHLAFNFTVVDGHLAAGTPTFLGSNPAEVREGPRTGLRALAAEQDLGRALLHSLSPDQLKSAVIADKAPADILSEAKRKASPLSPSGLPASRLNSSQKKILQDLIQEYVGRLRPEFAATDLEKIRKAGFGKIEFAWAGPDTQGQGHYYRVQGPTFLLEYDCTQNNANHIHAVWRDFDGDFGDDVLARHYRETPH